MCDIDHYPNLNDYQPISRTEFEARRHFLLEMGSSNDFIGPEGKKVEVDWILFYDTETEAYVKFLQIRQT